MLRTWLGVMILLDKFIHNIFNLFLWSIKFIPIWACEKYVHHEINIVHIMKRLYYFSIKLLCFPYRILIMLNQGHWIYCKAILDILKIIHSYLTGTFKNYSSKEAANLHILIALFMQFFLTELNFLSLRVVHVKLNKFVDFLFQLQNY